MATVGQLLILISGSNAPLTAALASSEAQLRGFSATAGTQGAATAGHYRAVGLAAGAMAIATAAATAGSINAAADFQDKLGIINTIAHQTPAELNRTGEAIRAMAVSSGEPLNTLADAFYDLLSAGVPASQAMRVLSDSTTLAIGGLATTEQTVDLLTTAMNSYGLNAQGVTRVTDQFALAIEHGKVTAAELSATFAQVAPVAQQAGISTAELAASYAVLTSKGVPAAEVSTQMNRAIIELLKPNADLIALQERTGVVFADVARERGLVVALQEMREAAAASGVPFQDLFGRLEGMKFALQTTGPNFKTYSDELVAMHSATGTASAQAEERMGTFNRQAAILGQSLSDLAISVGNGFLPQATAFVQQVSAAVQGVSAWARENPGLANTILMVVGGVSALVAGVVFLSPIIGVLGTAFGVLLSPITLIAGAIAGLAAHFGLLGEGPKGFVDGLAQSLSSMLPATGPVRDALNLIGAAIDAIPGIVATAQAAIENFATALSAAWAQFGPGIIDAVSTSFKTLGDVVGGVAGFFGPLISQVAQFVTSAGFLNTVATAVGTAFNIIKTAIDGVVSVISTVIGWISTFVTHLTGARDAGAQARGVFEGLRAVFGAIVDIVTAIVRVISTVVTAFIDAGNQTGAFGIILGAFKVAADAVNFVLGLIGDALRGLFTAIGDVATSIGGVLTVAFNAIKAVIDGVVGVIRGLIDALRTVIDLAAQALTALGKLAGQGAGQGPKLINPTDPLSLIGGIIGSGGGSLLGFAAGGTVPGPVGSPQLAVVHGGETVTPPGQGGAGPTSLTLHTHISMDGREVAEVVEKILLDNAMSYSSGLVGSPVTS